MWLVCGECYNLGYIDRSVVILPVGWEQNSSSTGVGRVYFRILLQGGWAFTITHILHTTLVLVNW